MKGGYFKWLSCDEVGLIKLGEVEFCEVHNTCLHTSYAGGI